MLPIKLSDKISVGKYTDCFIIAEVGSNWSSLEDCKYSIRMAKACGANAVKFQMYTTKALYGYEPAFLDSQVRGQLNPDWLPILKEWCDKNDIEFMCSAFSEELLELVDPYVNAHKLASAEMTHVGLLKMLRKIGKPVFYSMGSHGLNDIQKATDMLGACQKVLMYCVSDYPAKYVDFHKMQYLGERHKVLYGYSDHTINVMPIPEEACHFGAVVLEKHVNFVDAQGPDSAHSLNTTEFQHMVKRIRGERTSFSSGEQHMIKRYNRRLKVIKRVEMGETLVYGYNFGIFRSLEDDTRAGSPFLLSIIDGKSAKKAMEPGEGLWADDVR